MQIECTRFRVKKGKSRQVDEWMKMLNDRMSEVMLTLQDEKMYVETIFRENVDGTEYLYWFSVQGEDGSELKDSVHDVDKKHMEFWDECIDESYAPVDLESQVVMIPKKVRAAME